MRARAAAALLVLTAGCLNEYHPEYRPQTSTTYVQNVSYPTTIVTEVLAQPVRVTSSAPPSRGMPRESPMVAAPPSIAAPPPEIVPRPRFAERASYVSGARTYTEEGDRVLRAVPQEDQSEQRARCRAGHASSCRDLPGIHLSGDVRIHGNVTMFGDVYLNDSPSRS